MEDINVKRQEKFNKNFFKK